MAQGRPRDARKEREWQQWMRRWQTSGLSVRAFCGRHGLTEVSFYAWRRRLRQRPSAGTRFLPVSIGVDPEPVAAAALELVLSGERRLRVPPGFDAATLRRLLAVLEETPPC